MMTPTRRGFLQGVAALSALALAPSIDLSAIERLPDAWVYDPPTGTWRNAGASARMLRAAQRKAGVRVVRRPYPKGVTATGPFTDFGRARLAGQAREWGIAVPGDAVVAERALTETLAHTLRHVGPVWYEPPHLRAVFRSIEHPVVAFYGVSP